MQNILNLTLMAWLCCCKVLKQSHNWSTLARNNIRAWYRSCVKVKCMAYTGEISAESYPFYFQQNCNSKFIPFDASRCLDCNKA